jgi:hypothetical protein
MDSSNPACILFWGNSSLCRAWGFCARREVARIDWRIVRVLMAVSVLSLTGGCETTSGILADLSGDLPIATPKPEPQAPRLADRIVVRKSNRTLELLHDGVVIESFPIALGREPRGPKQQEGNGRTPEGIYRIDSRSLQTSLHARTPHFISGRTGPRPYTSVEGGTWRCNLDPRFAQRLRSLRSAPRVSRLDEGCISVGNAAIVKIWDAVPDGTPIEILP